MARHRNPIHPLGTYFLVGEGKPRPIDVLASGPLDPKVKVYDYVARRYRTVPRAMVSSDGSRRFNLKNAVQRAQAAAVATAAAPPPKPPSRKNALRHLWEGAKRLLGRAA